MYGYVYTVTRSRQSALASGVMYGMSGFMMAHLGHIGIIHCAAWLPLIIWSLEMLRRKWNPFWFVVGSIAVAFCFLAGQSQIFFYSLLLSVSYAIALGWSAPVGRRTFYLYALLLFGLGIGLAAIQLIPTAELINLSVRTEFRFEEFVSFSLTPKHLVTFVFPYLFGLSNHPVKLYFGDWNLTELAGYVGLLPLMLAAIGFASSRRNPLSIFWLVAGLVALLLALGDATPLARMIYYVPLINRFRAPARHLLEMTFAVSVLGGLGLSAIRQGKVGISLVWRTIFISALAIIACLVAIVIFRDQLVALAEHAGVARLSLLPWANGAVGIPLLIFLFGAFVLAWWCGKPNSFLRTLLLMLVLFFDLASFGWFYEWRYASPDVSELSQPASTIDYRDALSSTHQRILPVLGIHGPRETMPPNTSRLWGIPSATGSNVLRLERVSRLLSIAEGGDVDASWSEPNNQSIHLMAIRYVFTPRGDFITQDGVSWLKKDLDLWIGSGCDHGSTPSLTFDIPKPFIATRVGLVSMLACSTGIPDGTEVARLSVTEVNGRVQTRSIVAGRDSSEWSVDCGNVRPMMRHGRATVFDTYPAKMYDVPCEGHHFATAHALDEATVVKSISVQWTGGTAALVVQKLSLINDSTHTSYAFNPEYLDSSSWRLVDETDKIRLYENLRAMPRVWLAHDFAVVKPEEALQIIKSSKLPDERDFDPARTALVEEPLSVASQEIDPNASAEVVSLSDTTMEVRTSSISPSILLTSDPYYPGWGVSIDGQRAHLFRADYAIRGVWLPAGQHVVRFEFSPRSFYYGAVISALSLLALVVIFSKALILIARRKRLRANAS
nr:YfhO family protein [Acidobacteriota bacterium]